jgi:hypothetical protein
MRSHVKFYDGTCISRITSKKIGKNNKSGFTGVSYNKSRKKWWSRLRVQGKTIYLGTFDRIEDAVKARKKAEKKYHIPLINEYKKMGPDNSGPKS